MRKGVYEYFWGRMVTSYGNFYNINKEETVGGGWS